MNPKKHILFALTIVSLILVGCGKDSPTYIPQHNEQSNLVVPTSSSEITKTPETPTPTNLVHSPTDSKKSVPITTNIRKIEPLSDLLQQVSEKEEIAPKDWSLLDYKENDFNKDGLKDMVGVIEHQGSDEIMYPRILLIYFNNGNSYSLNLMNPYLIRNRDEGGVFGDPYQELSVEKNTFTTNTYGGSAWRWSENNTYEYKNGD